MQIENQIAKENSYFLHVAEEKVNHLVLMKLTFIILIKFLFVSQFIIFNLTAFNFLIFNEQIPLSKKCFAS